MGSAPRDRQVAVLYVSSLISHQAFARYFEGQGVVPSIAAQKFHRLFVEGLMQDPRVSEVVAISAPPVSRRVSTTTVHRRHEEIQRGVLFVSLPFVNVPILRQAGIFASGLVELAARIRQDVNAVIVCDVLCGAPSLAALAVGALTKSPVVGVVTDVPRRRPAVGSAARRAVDAALGWVSTAWLTRFDGYLVLTDPMNTVVNPKARPSVVVEGLVDVDDVPLESYAPAQGSSPRVILYTGSTHRVYGLPMLVEAFLKEDLPGWELHICGRGDYDTELQGVSARVHSVRFLGVIDNDEAVRRQREASVLVNPRPTTAEFTKYSFPSKNMEYMASGRPLMTTRLPGMPEDYLPHVIILDDESVEGYGRMLRHVAGLEDRKLSELGSAARRFVVEHKNKFIQSRKLMDLVERMVPGRVTAQSYPRGSRHGPHRGQDR